MIKLKDIDYRHYICVAITLALIIGEVFSFPNAFGRLAESVRDFGLSVGYSFCEMFGIQHSIAVTVNELPKMPFFPLPPVLGEQDVVVSLPDTWNGFVNNWHSYWQLWIDKNNFLSYLAMLGDSIVILCEIAIIVIPIILIAYVCFSNYLKKQNNDYDKDSKPLIAFKFLSAHTYQPVKRWLKAFWGFVVEHKAYLIIWLCYALFCFNAFAILFEFLAFYCYFIVSFDFANIYLQIYKLAIDLSALFNFVPIWVWVIVVLVMLDRWRKSIAYKRLEHFERKNCGFINERPLVTMVVGTMGKGKTTMLTDMCLSTETMFRHKAFEKILENDLKFPNFPWINLEVELRRAIEKHSVYNLATCKRFVQSKHRKFIKLMSKGKKSFAKHKYFFDYDYERFGTAYDNKLEMVDVWQVIETYAQLYFIYIIQSSLIVSNYSVRTDNLLSDLGNFPLWNMDFFHRDSRLIDGFSRHAHILDFDFLRLARTVIDDNKYRHALEFGVIAVSEIGKERRNALELRERGVKANDYDTNQKNDGFNDGLKMRRQSAMVDNFCFLKIISDEQRPESFGADARDLFDVISIKERKEDSLAMPFFTLAELLYSWVIEKFKSAYSQYRHVRGDNTLFVYLCKNIVAFFERYYKGIHNLFGFNELTVQVENGTLDGTFTEHSYFFAWKKIYARRFSTDCMSAFWAERALHSPVGLNDLREYETARATWEELKAQNSYFVNDLLSGMYVTD